jgi:hypothetical protein
MLTPFDDFPIHPSADPIAHPASADPNHYDRYWFNGQAKDGSFFIGGAMGHYPVRGVVDAAFSVVYEGIEHSVYASGFMPLDRSTAVGPLRVEVPEPMRTVRLVADRGATGLGADLTFRARTVAIEEPRQRLVGADGVLGMDHTRLTQWGSWEGTIWIDGTTIDVDPAQTVATRDRSWGMRPVGQQLATQREQRLPQVFWHWLPLHFDDFCTHMALHERTHGDRWLEAAMIVPLLEPGAPACGYDPATHLSGLAYDIKWEPGRREMASATFFANRPDGSEVRIDLEKLYTFRMRGIGYSHPRWSHGSAHGELEVGREDIALDDFDPLDLSSLHLQNIVRATLDGQVGHGVLEQIVLGDHEPTGMRGFTDGWAPAP